MQSFVNYRHLGITQLVLSYDIYDDIEIKNGLFYRSLKQDERYVLPFIENKVTLDSLEYKRIKEWNNEKNVVFKYSFHETSGEYSLGNLGVLSKLDHIDDDSYYLSVNSYKLGDTLYHSYINTLRDVNQLEMVIMDLINLSEVFCSGIKKESQSISKFMTISRYLEIFFGKIVVNICKKYQLCLIYSGGDDIIFTCCRKNTQSIIDSIINAFKEFTDFNSSFRLRYGIEELKESYLITYKKIKEKFI